MRFAGLRTVASGGLNSVKVPGTSRNRAWAGKIRRRLGLAEAAAPAAPGDGGVPDRAFDSNAFLAEIAATGAVPLARAKSTRTPLVLRHLPDGSYLSCLDGLDVRIAGASVVMAGADGSRIADRYRLITTLADHRAYPADALVRLYHERWEIESAYAVSSLAGSYGYRLRPSDPLAPLTRDVARSLVEAGFTLHHCARYDPLYRRGGVCVLPVAAGPSHDDPGGVVVSWTTHDLLSLDWDRQASYHGAHQAINGVLAQVLSTLGYQVKPFGAEGASLVTGHLSRVEETGR